VAGVFVQTIAQHTKEGFTFSHSHTKQKQKEQLKFKTPKTILRKPKEGEKKLANKNRDKYDFQKLQKKNIK
jgi:hypothetical protein